MNRNVGCAGILVLAFLAVFLAYWLCFALWMTAYHQCGPLLNAWQARFYTLAASLLVVFAADLYLVIKVIESRAAELLKLRDLTSPDPATRKPEGGTQ